MLLRPPRINLAVCISLTFALFAPISSALAQRIELLPQSPQSASEAPAFRLIGFPPDTSVRISYLQTPPDGQAPSYGSAALYRTDKSGLVAPGAQPVSGDWKVADPEAPFWAFKEMPTAPLPPVGIVVVTAEAGPIRAEARYNLAPRRRVKTEAVTAFPGAFLVRPANAGKALPLIIVLGGSEGNADLARGVAPRLASEGFAVLGLPYYSPDRGQGQAIPGLPSIFSEIPVDRLERVQRWAQADTRVDAERIGLWGNSKGAEFAIIAAANYPWLDAVVAIVPTDVVLEGFGSGKLERTGTSSFKLNGRPLPFVPSGPSGRDTVTKQVGRWANPSQAAAARIPIERFDGLLLVAGGARDTSLDSSGASQSIAERRAKKGKATVSLIFHDVGHDIAGGLSPIDTSRGNSVVSTGRARRDVWAAAVRLFRSAWPN